MGAKFLGYAVGCAMGIALLFTQVAFAEDCQSLNEDLQGLRKAQQTVISSLVTNHELFASTLESYADAVPQASLASTQKAPKAIAANMAESAKAFRQRGHSAKAMSQKLDRATQELISRLQKCLK